MRTESVSRLLGLSRCRFTLMRAVNEARSGRKVLILCESDELVNWYRQEIPRVVSDMGAPRDVVFRIRVKKEGS